MAISQENLILKTNEGEVVFSIKSSIQKIKAIFKETISNILRENYKECIKLLNTLQTEIVSILVLKGRSEDVIREANDIFFKCKKTINNEINVINNEVKKRNLYKRMSEIAKLLAENGIYIGQEVFDISDISSMLKSKINELTEIYIEYKIDHSRVYIEDFLGLCKFIRKLIDKIKFDEEFLSLKVNFLMYLNKIEVSLPFYSNKNVEKVENNFSMLKTYADLISLMLIDKKTAKSIMKMIEESDGKYSKDEIEEIAKKIIENYINREGKDVD